MHQWIDSWRFRAEGAYHIQGENELLQLENYVSFEAGIGQQYNHDLFGELAYWGATAPANGSGTLGELQYKLTKRSKNDTGFTLKAVAGTTEDSLDYGLGGSFFVRF